jgi:hypothetical protein
MLGIGLMTTGGMILLITGCGSMWDWASSFYYRFRLEAALLVLSHRTEPPTDRHESPSPSRIDPFLPGGSEFRDGGSDSDTDSDSNASSDSDRQIQTNLDGLIQSDLSQRRLSQDSRNSE